MLPNTLHETVINHTKNIFAHHHIPKTVISDNGPQFISDEHDKFMKSWGFDHNFSSPEYPQSNGIVEWIIQTVKKTLRKAKLSNNDPYLAILALRTTPQQKHSSPAQLLMNRNLQTTLPSPSQLLEQSYNRNVKNLPPLNPGQSIQTNQDKSWSHKGIIIESDIPRRSYKILTDKNTVICRNQRHILKSNETFKLDLEDTDSSFANKKETVAPRNSDEIIHEQSLNNLAEHQSKSQQSVIDPQPISHKLVPDEITSDETVVRRPRSGRIIKTPSRYKWL